MSDLAQIIEDILALHAEEDEIKVSRKSLYADAQDAGFNKSAIGLAVRTIRASRKQETPAALEKQSLADQYVAEYEAHERSLAHVHVREATEPSPRRAVHTAHPESEHVTRSASAQPHSATGEPSILSKPGDEGTGQGVFDRHETFGTPSGAEAGSRVRAPAPIREDA